MIRIMTRSFRFRGIVALGAFFAPWPIFAQGCAMCYQSAAGSGAQFIQALRHGILIMFFPPILIMAAILFVAYRKRNQFNTAEGAPITRDSFGEDVPPEWGLSDEG
jgi:hypothetical protein